MKDLIFLYFIVSYSMGIITLFFAFVIYLRKKEKTLGKFLLSTLSLTVVIVISTLLDYTSPSGPRPIKDLLGMMSYLGADAFVYFLPSFVDGIFMPRSAVAGRIFLPLGIVSFLSCAILYFASLSRFIHYISMGALLLAILYSVFVIVIRIDLRSRLLYVRFSQTMALVSVFLLPAIIGIDILPFSRANAALGYRTPLTLPLTFMCWCGTYMVLQTRSLLRSWEAVEEISDAFIRRFHITRKEKQVVECIIRGKSYKEIMDELGITMPTVKTHITNIYRKTASYNKIDLIKAVRNAAVSA
jgi:DNA-binding CsgD family transcriptional regulator